MTDGDWIRSFGDKNVYCNKELVGKYVRSDTDLQVNGNSKVNGQSEIGGDLLLSGANTWKLHTPDDGRKQLYFGKGANGNIDAWPINFEENGIINCNGIRMGNMTMIYNNDEGNLDFRDNNGPGCVFGIHLRKTGPEPFITIMKKDNTWRNWG